MSESPAEAADMSTAFNALSLLGGPLHRLGGRLGWVRAGTNTVVLGLVLGMGSWTILASLAIAEGFFDKLASLSVVGVHVRLLVAIPLLFVCETILDPRVRLFAAGLVRARVVPERAVSALQVHIARTLRWKDAWLPEAACLLVAVLWSAFGSGSHQYGATAAADSSRLPALSTLTGLWYWAVCLPLLRFLLLRWLWRLVAWCLFLWRLSRLELNLVTTHPDGAAGLGYLESVHSQFFPLVLAISSIQAAAIAEGLAVGSMNFQGAFPALGLLITVQAVLVLGPLFIFTPKLWRARVDGLERYMELASHYVNAFEAKWLGTGGNARPGAGDTEPEAEPLLGTPDLQSLADLGSAVNRVQEMRWAPFGMRLLTITLIATLAPVAPLLLFKYPLTELAQKFFANLTGL